jgi:hypothetical protein
MNLKDRMAGIDANLDDLQSGMEACARASDALQIDTTKFDGLLSAPLFRSVLQHVKDLQSCARDQRVAMLELRSGIARLHEELALSHRPPPTAHARRNLRVRSR